MRADLHMKIGITALVLFTFCLTAHCQVKQNDLYFDTNASNSVKIQDLVILCKTWGYLKYYHPQVRKGKYNWDEELLKILPQIEQCSTIEERNKLLYAWASNLGKFKTTKYFIADSSEIKLYPDYGWINNSDLGKSLEDLLIKIKYAKRDTLNYYAGTMPFVENPDFSRENPYNDIKFPDGNLRLLILFRYWNIIQYYFPYRYLMEDDWTQVLKDYIPKFISTNNVLDYQRALLSLVAKIKDAHAQLYNCNELDTERGKHFAPFKVNFIEGKAVVTENLSSDAYPDSTLRKGDIILSVDNKNIETIIKEQLPFISASNYTGQLEQVAFNLLRTKKKKIEIVFLRNATLCSTTVYCNQDKISHLNSRLKILYSQPYYKNIGSKILYLHPQSVRSKNINLLMAEAIYKKGIIIDLRGAAQEPIYSLARFLYTKPTIYCKISTVSKELPGLFKLKSDTILPIEFNYNLNDTINNITDQYRHLIPVEDLNMTNKDFVGSSEQEYVKNHFHFNGKIILLVNENTLSSSEFTAMFLRTNKTIVIGSITSGADGNVSSIPLFGGIYTDISGIGIYYPDGRETQRIGIVPDIEVKPTIKGITEDKDELLDKAIEILNYK